MLAVMSLGKVTERGAWLCGMVRNVAFNHEVRSSKTFRDYPQFKKTPSGVPVALTTTK
jgi:hypothetical protein